ncbi:hypothetical protein [Oerskovia enterophila]|uniref:hypothetical protein n=1 Tax=Oerskovia enterophila TaxID=43678 RepID=UPI003394EBA1
MTATTVSIALLATGLPAATAVGDQTESTARLIADVAPDQGDVIVGERDQDGIAASLDNVDIIVPNDPKAPIVLASPSDGKSLAVSLPSDLDLADGAVASDGTLVFSANDGGADAAVQILGDGSARIQTVIPDASAQHEFTYSFGDGITPILTEDGSVLLTTAVDASTSTVIGELAAPWAVDAAGDVVATAYVIEGNSVTQRVDVQPGATYPVVADPSISYGLGIYYHFNRAETATLASYGLGGASAITAGCAALGSLAAGIGAIVAGAACAVYGGPFFFQAGVAQNSSPKRCVFAVSRGPVLTSGTYKDSRCK